MGVEFSVAQLVQLRNVISKEIGQAYKLVILPKLRSVDEKLDELLELTEDHKRRLNRLEAWRDRITDRTTGSGKPVVATLLLAVALCLAIAAGLLLVWLSSVPK